ncbi:MULTISPECIES: IS3 family transposase [Alcaligenes]|uniref:IS3 family transposase n=4 Tax=Alcaligenes phenolicus TaxID=232846 RepID=A0AAW5W0P2_9BURK|nr:MULTISPECIES: IS3 family transposase [Alcaligenes]MCX5567561.1 IS3 family transposase [Alcaligenes phenolicus]QHS35576.1 IS3 family transposase [Alcaligenes faecalis]QHS36044.1 IS3 family transposase [Alcaligenes faecalis]QHS36089.1 IS3 family transposase [Alcaligenes faecalis]QHS36167.1 IS3 family transposase [Alcaligenes faecalis]
MSKNNKFSPEVRERAVRMVQEHRDEYRSQWAAVQSIAPKIGCSGHTLLQWVQRAEVEAGTRPGLPQAEQERIKALEREVKELRRANEILKSASGFFRSSGARPRTEEINAYIDQHRYLYGVEPICEVLQVAPSAYWRHAARCRNPELRSQRAKRDERLMVHVQRVWEQNFRVYGARKIWKQLAREGVAVARCTVERLMRHLGIEGVRRGKRVRTTIPDSEAACPRDLVKRHFEADRPNRLWVADFTYVSTWQGWLYVAFVIDAYAKRIVGWRASSSMTTDFVLDALEQAVYDRRPTHSDGLVHHSDRGSQYVSIRYSERLGEAGINPSVGSTGSAYDNALAETINGLYKTEVIHRRAPWKTKAAVELATLEWVSWFNHQRLLESIGDIPPAEAEERYYRQLAAPAAEPVSL